MCDTQMHKNYSSLFESKSSSSPSHTSLITSINKSLNSLLNTNINMYVPLMHVSVAQCAHSSIKKLFQHGEAKHGVQKEGHHISSNRTHQNKRNNSEHMLLNLHIQVSKLFKITNQPSWSSIYYSVLVLESNSHHQLFSEQIPTIYWIVWPYGQPKYFIK